MKVFGIILTVGGVAATIFGYSMNNSMQMQIGSLLNSGTTNPGTPAIVLGVVGIIAGIVMIVKDKGENKQ